MKKLERVEIVIPGKIPTTTFQSKGINRKTGRIFTRRDALEAYQHFESYISSAVRRSVVDHLNPPYTVRISYYYKSPQNVKRIMDDLHCAVFPKTTKPDVDNLGKMILDILTRTGLIDDDSKVYLYEAQKFYTVEDNEWVAVKVSSDEDIWS